MFRPDDELKRLARLAVELGVDAPFLQGTADPHAVLAAVAGLGEPGQHWLAELEKSRDPWFNTSTGDGFYHHHRSWNDDLSVPFSALPRYVALVRAGKSIDRPTKQLRRERTRIIAEYRELLATDAERTVFDQILCLCHVVFPYVEDHNFYCEHWFTTRFYRKMREFGALLARKGGLEDGEDVFHLQHFEVDQALVDVMLAWAAGSEPVAQAFDAPPEAAWPHLEVRDITQLQAVYAGT
jgi:pyruvate,water dikinase